MTNNMFYAICVMMVAVVAIGTYSKTPQLTKAGQRLAETRLAECNDKGGIFILSNHDQPVFSVCIEGQKVLNFTTQLPGLWK